MAQSTQFKVWIDIERIDTNINGDDSYEDEGLPDEVGVFNTLEDAEHLVRTVLKNFNPEALETSDHRLVLK